MDGKITKFKSKDYKEVILTLFKRLRKYKLLLYLEKCTFRVMSRKVHQFIVRERGIGAYPDKVKVIAKMPPPQTCKAIFKLFQNKNQWSGMIMHSWRSKRLRSASNISASHTWKTTALVSGSV